jgi:hypothetical protein
MAKKSSSSSWFSAPLRRGKTPCYYRPSLEPLEERTLLTGIVSAGGLDTFLLTPVPDDALLAMHIHPHLSILIDGQNQVIPGEIGVEPDGDLPIHTHDDSGTLHIESPVAQEFHLRDFFAVWGQSFTSEDILGHPVDATHPLTMTVNGQVSNDLGSLVLHDHDDIVIQYGSTSTADVQTNRTAYSPGATAMIGGMGFTPGEAVDVQVAHIDGKPNGDSRWTVVADADGVISTAWLVGGDVVGSTFQIQASGATSHESARTTFIGTKASTAVWTARPDYAPGTTAVIGGSGFAAGETVNLQVMHIDGRPNTDASHAPWQVVADANGDFSTTWLVDTVDAGGSTLEVSAVGATSSEKAQAQFTDSAPVPHPFWIFGHNPNANQDATDYLNLGANALEPDIEFIPGDGLVVRHDTGIFSSSHDLISYLQNLSNLAGTKNLALVVFDVKTEAAQHAGAAAELLNDIQVNLLDNHPEVHVILSVASSGDADSFFTPLTGQPFNHAIGFQIDSEEDPLGEANHLRAILGQDVLIGFGDGTAGCCGRSAPLVGPFFGPNTPPALEHAVWARTALGALNMVTYGFAVTGTDTMKMLINAGVDGIIPSDFVLAFGQVYPLDTLDMVNLVNAHYGGVYLATSADDPFSKFGAKNGVITGSRQGYALEVKTATSSGAGTDANITFTLHGEFGDASMTMDSSWSKEMENGDTNYVFIPSGDLGRLKSVTAEQDGSGGLWGNALGLGSKWDVDYIKVRSFFYIGTDGVYPTSGDPNKSLYEYNADFGGQTLDDSTPFTVDLKSGIPFLATLTSGDLVLNMGPDAGARVEGDISDGNESFTVHHVSTEPDGSETVTVAAFGGRPQTYKGVKQIHASGGAGSDTLTVDGVFSIPIFWDGGGNSGDNMVVTGYDVGQIVSTYTGAHSGTVKLGTGALISYQKLMPIKLSGTAADLLIDLSQTTVQNTDVVLGDDGGAGDLDGTQDAGFSAIHGSTFEFTEFRNPTHSLTIQLSNLADTIAVQKMDAAFGVATTITGGTGADRVNVQATSASLNIQGTNGADVVNIGSLAPITTAGTLVNINGVVTVQNASGRSSVTIDDSGDGTGRADTLDTTVIGTDTFGRLSNLGNPAAILWDTGPTSETSSVIINGGSGGNTINVKQTHAVGSGGALAYIFNTGTGKDTVNIQATSANANYVFQGQAGLDLVNIGSLAPTTAGGTVANLNGELNIENTNSFDLITVDDSADATARTVTLSSFVNPRDTEANMDSYGKIHALAAVDINFEIGDIDTVNLRGGVGKNTLAGPDLLNTWNLNATNHGRMTALPVTFNAFANLIGGSARDVFHFANGSKISGIINGGGGAGPNWLDYSAVSASVTVNLGAGIASVVTGGVKSINNVIGSANGGDHLTGNAAGGILEGHNSGNTITAGAGRTVIIGGFGLNTLIGGAADDLFINGRTIYDANYATLEATLGTWQSGLTYLTRIATLQVAGPKQLKIGTTVFVFSGRNGGVGPRVGHGGAAFESTLIGNGGMNWFITNSFRSVADKKPGEAVTTS